MDIGFDRNATRARNRGVVARLSRDVRAVSIIPVENQFRGVWRQARRLECEIHTYGWKIGKDTYENKGCEK